MRPPSTPPAFLPQVLPSYASHCARVAGVPPQILCRAEEVLRLWQGGCQVARVDQERSVTVEAPPSLLPPTAVDWPRITSIPAPIIL